MVARVIGLVACLAFAVPAQAGLITVAPLSTPTLPAPFLPVGDFPPGAVIPSDQLITNQYAGFGVRFDGTALGLVGAIPAWLPVGSAVGGPGVPDPLAGQLNFRPGYNGVVGGSFVVPGTNQPTNATSVTVTFVGGEPGSAAAVFFDSQGNWLGNPTPFAGSVVESPNGTATLTFAAPNIARFELYRTFTLTTDWGNPTPWGVTSIGANTVGSPSSVATPEPGTLALFAAGLFAVGVVRRRRTVS